MTTEHEIKIHTVYYNRVLEGVKPFEIREDDRDYQVGDILLMREFDPERGEYISHSAPIRALVTYKSTFQQKDGWCVLGTKILEGGAF
jgi:hypothetical protein